LHIAAELTQTIALLTERLECLIHAPEVRVHRMPLSEKERDIGGQNIL